LSGPKQKDCFKLDNAVIASVYEIKATSEVYVSLQFQDAC